jgi:hypothetical protein|tara:strand:- start:166 stop:462 length:297 start_codon:yes stop_codon:yes gene_type:complete
MKGVVAYVPNLMDRSRFGSSVEFINKLSLLSEVEANVLIVDLSSPGVLEHLPERQYVIGYAPHVDETLLDEASVSGCNEALARSVFFRRLPEIMKTYE